MHKNGAVVWVEAHSNVVVEGGRPVGMRGVTLDISVRKRLELERAELLAREQSARADAVAANRLKDDFLATLSHELRTPLNAILGYARMLRTGVIDPARQARALEIVERNATSLTQMVEDVLDVSRMMSGQDSAEPRDRRSSPDRRRRRLPPCARRPMPKACGIRDRPRPPRPDRSPAMPTASSRSSGTCCRTPCSFTPRDGHVEVRLERTGGEALITVSDTGAGIEPRVSSTRVRAIPAGGQPSLTRARRTRARPGDRARSGRTARRHRSTSPARARATAPRSPSHCRSPPVRSAACRLVPRPLAANTSGGARRGARGRARVRRRRRQGRADADAGGAGGGGRDRVERPPSATGRCRSSRRRRRT